MVFLEGGIFEIEKETTEVTGDYLVYFLQLSNTTLLDHTARSAAVRMWPVAAAAAALLAASSYSAG